MSRIDDRIAQCEGICIQNHTFLADLYGLRDARNGNRNEMEKLTSLDDFRRYQRSYWEGLEIKLIDAKERQNGSHQPESNPCVCVSAVR